MHTGDSPWEKGGQGVKLSTYLQLVPRLRMHEAILPLPQYVFMAQYLVKHMVTLPLPLWSYFSSASPTFPLEHIICVTYC